MAWHPLPSRCAIVAALMFLPYGTLVGWFPGQLSKHALLGAVALVVLIAAWAPPILSDDIFRYMWDGRVLAHGVDPYAYAPSSAELAPLRDTYWAHINNASVPTIYPPVAQGFFGLADMIAHHPASFKTLLALGHLLVTAALYSHSAQGAMAFGLNPLAVMESALAGHIDVLAGGFVLAFALYGQRQGFFRAAIAAVAATGTKLIGLLLLPLLLRRRFMALLLGGALSLSFLMPVAGAGHGESGAESVAGLSHYAGRWQGNGGTFQLVEKAVAAALSLGARPDGQLDLREHRRLFDAAEGTAFDPWRAYEREKKPIYDRALVDVRLAANWLTRVLLALILMGVALTMAIRKVPMAEAARWLVLLALLCAPQLHPWYLLWLLPLEAYLGRWVVIAWSAVVWAAYMPLDGWVSARQWTESPHWVGIQLLVVTLAIGLELAAKGSGRSPWRTAIPKEGRGEVSEGG